MDFWAPWTRLAKHRYDLAAKGRDRQRVVGLGRKTERSEGLWFSLGRHFRFSWITSTEITSVFEVCDCQSSGWASENVEGVLGECCSTYRCLMNKRHGGDVSPGSEGGNGRRMGRDGCVDVWIRSGRARVVFNRLQRNGGSKCLCDGLSSDLVSITHCWRNGKGESRGDLGMHHSRSRYWSAAAGTLPPWWKRGKRKGLMCDAWFSCCHLHGPDGTGAHIGYA